MDKYIKTLTEQNYSISKIFVSSASTENYVQNEQIIPCKRTKELVKQMLENLNKDEILLISGPSSFTLEVRYALLERMGF